LRARIKIVIGATAVAVLAAGGAAYALSQDSNTTETTTTCDFAEHYTTVSTLAAHSDLVVAGQVGKKLGTTSQDGNGATDFAFTVTSALSDTSKRLPQGISTVKVHQSGTSAGTQCQEDPLFTSGSRDVLFLREYAPGSFSVVGGPNGRLVVQGSQVSPFSAQSLQFTGTIDDLARQISAGG
jgi:hypothetical protein